MFYIYLDFRINLNYYYLFALSVCNLLKYFYSWLLMSFKLIDLRPSRICCNFYYLSLCSGLRYFSSNYFSFCIKIGFFLWYSPKNLATSCSLLYNYFSSYSRFFLLASILSSISCRFARSFICIASLSSDSFSLSCSAYRDYRYFFLFSKSFRWWCIYLT